MVVVIMLWHITSYAQPYRLSVDMDVPYPPTLVNVDGNEVAYYELHFTNFSTDTIQLTKVDVVDTRDASVYLSSNGTDLKNRFSRIGLKERDTTVFLPPGTVGVAYLEISVKQKTKVDIIHSVTLIKNIRNKIAEEFEVKGASLNLSAKNNLLIGSPLKEGLWIAISEPSWEMGHRRVIYTVNGKARIPGRYAIDFVKLNDKGEYATGNEDEVKNWLGYGVGVYAVADGEVVSVINNYPESVTLSSHDNPPAEEATGNYVSIKIGEKAFCFYEHLKPGSIRVKPGQKVKMGELIALLGYTGDSTGPHLHFHIAEYNSPLGAEGIPFAFEGFIELGYYKDLSEFGKKKWIEPATKKVITKQRPGPNTVIQFNSSK